MNNAVKNESWRTLYPFDSKFLKLEDGAYHYLDEGEGEPVVMVHGNPTWSFYYRRLADALKSRYRIIVPDHIGCGLSDKPQDYAYTLENHINNLEKLLIGELGLTKFNLVIHDWGGAIGMGVAVRHPERVSKITILNTAAFLMPKGCPLRIHVCKAPILGDLAIRGFNAFAGSAVHMAIAHHERMTPEIKEGFLAPYNNWHNRIANLRFVQDIPLNPSHPTWKTVADIEKKLHLFQKTPTQICWGAKDFCFTMDYLEKWKKYFPHAETNIFDDAGHYVLEDAHERIIPLVKDFLETNAEKTTTA